MKKFAERTVLPLVFCLLLCGCGSLRLHDSEADATATAAKTDYDASKIGEALKAEHAMLDALEKKEIEAFRKVTLAGRDLDLLSLLTDSGTAAGATIDNGLIFRFNTLVNGRLAALTGSSGDAGSLGRSLFVAESAERAAVSRERKARSQLQTFHPKFHLLPACGPALAALTSNPTADAVAALTKDPAFKPSAIGTSSAWTPTVVDLAKACSDVLESRSKRESVQVAAENGELGRANKLAASYKAALAAQQEEAKKAGEDLKAATGELAAAHKAAAAEARTSDLTCEDETPATGAAAMAVTTPAAATAPAGTVAEKKNKMCGALARLKKLGDSGVKVLSEERIAKINAILVAASGLPPTAGQDTPDSGLALLGATARFGQSLQQYRSAGKLPALEPLLIEKQLATAQLVHATAGEELAKTRVSRAEEFRNAVLLETDLLLQANATLGGYGKVPDSGTPCTAQTAVFCASMQGLMDNKAKLASRPGEPANRMAYRALALLSESYTVARDRQQTAELKMVLTEYRESLLRSEAALAAWNPVISTPIDQLKTYHAGGLTRQDFVQLLQALGVVGIAVNVK